MERSAGLGNILRRFEETQDLCVQDPTQQESFSFNLKIHVSV
jgi:hypothetical protein